MSPPILVFPERVVRWFINTAVLAWTTLVLGTGLLLGPARAHVAILTHGVATVLVLPIVTVLAALEMWYFLRVGFIRAATRGATGVPDAIGGSVVFVSFLALVRNATCSVPAAFHQSLVTFLNAPDPAICPDVGRWILLADIERIAGVFAFGATVALVIKALESRTRALDSTDGASTKSLG